MLSLECDVVDISVQFDIKSCGPEGCNMVDSYESLNRRFPILDVVINYLNCADTEKVS